MAQKSQIIVMQGGLDLVTQPLQVPPGRVISAQNYESEDRGYRRRRGYERFDGQPKPHEAQYWVLDFDTGSTAIASGDTITGATSGATGIVIQDATVTSGSWAGNDAAGWVAIYNLSGSFQDNENIEVSASPVAIADGTQVLLGAADDTTSNTLLRAAIEARRAAIAAPTGIGSVLGVATYSGDVYCFRNHTGGTKALMYKATSAGWVEQTFGHTLDFTAGAVAEMVEGETITGGTSGATATVERVILQSGAWSGTAAGYLVLSGITGTFQAAETITGGTSTGTATASGAQAEITLPPNGRYRTVTHNFFGSSNLKRLYGANGEGYAFEWDGSVMAPIRTGISASLDKPNYVGVHANHLLLGFDGGAVMYSGTGLPLSFITTDGAGEIGIGEDITGINSNTRTATVITGQNKIAYLTGNDSTDFVLAFISEDSGAKSDTLQIVGQPYFMDDRGVRSLQASQAFGDWDIGTVTKIVKPWLDGKADAGVTVVGSVRNRASNQYILCFSDGSALSIYFGRNEPESMPLLFGFTPTCLHSGEDANGKEIILAGSSAGYVYELDAGTSDDSAEIEAWIRTPFIHQGSPNADKRYHRAFVDVADGGPETNLRFSVNFDYGDPDTPSGGEVAGVVSGGGGFFETAFWDKFYWSSGIQGQAIADLSGIGRNVSVVIMSDATYEEPHTVASVTINFSIRRQRR